MAYPLKVGFSADWFGISGRLFLGGVGGTLDSSGGIGIKGEWTYLAYKWSEAFSSETIFATIFPV